MKRLILLTLACLLTLTGVAQARYYIPKPHHACRVHFVKRTVRVRRNHRWVKQVRCMYVPPKVTTPAPTTPVPATPAPVQVRAGIDPAFTQDPANPLNVTWTFSAVSATALPTGTLSFQVAEPNAVGSSGGCVVDVSALATGGTCTVELPHFGPWQVTVSYTGGAGTVAPSSSTQIDTISPFSTTVSVESQTIGQTTNYTAAVVDQNKNSVPVDPSSIEWVIGDTTLGQAVGNFPNVGAVGTFQARTQYDFVTHQPDGTSICVEQTGWCGDLINPSDTFTVQAIYSPAAGASWTGSTSQPVPLVLSP